MSRINMEKRNGLVSGTAPGCPHSTSAFQSRKPILDRLEDSLAKRQLTGMRGLSASGKTSILLSLKTRLKKSFGPEIEILNMLDHLQDSISISPSFFEKALKQKVALIDEASIVYSSFYPSSIRTEFLDFIQELGKSVPVLVSYPRLPIGNILEGPVPELRTFTLSIRADEMDASRFLGLLFAGTNVHISEPTKRRIIELSGGALSAMGDLCFWIAREHSNLIFGSEKRVFIETDPDRLLAPPYSYKFKIQNSALGCLTEKEKAFLSLLIGGKVGGDDFRIYSSEIVGLFQLGVLNRKMEVLLPVRLALGGYSPGSY